MSPEVERLVRTLELSVHPEGGYYREIYRSTETVTRDALPSRFGGPRAFSTAIYFLVPSGTFSALHDIASDECWHHYEGDPLRVVTLDEAGVREDFVLGKALEGKERPFAVVPAGRVFGSFSEAPSDGRSSVGFSLVGCTVAPGFDFADFRMESRAALLRRFPGHDAIVTALTRA
jgi:predicted cupin superfamily sugar epimerase